MESRFGADFGGVRVHADDQAAESAHQLSAHAYTVGSDVFFGRSQYQPSTAPGRLLLAHELTHVLQQASGRPGSSGPMSQPGDAGEREAEQVAHEVLERQSDGRVSGPKSRISRSARATIQRWSYGSGAAPHTDYVEVPAAEKPRVDEAMAIVTRVVNAPKDYPRCPAFYKANCPGGTDTTLTDVYNRVEIWKDTEAGDLLGSHVDPHHVAYAGLAYRFGRWAMAASMFHEFIHDCGVASHDIGDQAKDPCGRLPDI
jgi:hypothetical protein